MPSLPDDGLTLRKVSEHGLGHLLSPYGPSDLPQGTARTRRWIAEGWRWILDQDSPMPWWFSLPAVSRTSITSPLILRAFTGYNQSREPSSRIRPFNFCLSAHLEEFGHPEGVDPTRFHLVAPYEDDPMRYLELPWVNRFTGKQHAISVQENLMDPSVAIVRSYGSVFASFLRHAEAKSLDWDGRAGVGEGRLERRPVREGTRAYIGKESNRIEEVGAGFWGRLEDVQAEYGQALDPWRRWVIPVLKEMPLSLLMRETGLDRRTIQRLRNRHARPR